MYCFSNGTTYKSSLKSYFVFWWGSSLPMFFPRQWKEKGDVTRLTPFWAKVTYWRSTGNARSWWRSCLHHQLSSCVGRQVREETHHGVSGSAQLCDPRQILIHLSLGFHILKWRWGCAKIDWNNIGRVWWSEMWHRKGTGCHFPAVWSAINLFQLNSPPTQMSPLARMSKLVLIRLFFI